MDTPIMKLSAVNHAGSIIFYVTKRRPLKVAFLLASPSVRLVALPE